MKKGAMTVVGYVLCLVLVGACKKEPGGSDAGVGGEDRDLEDSSMCCGGKRNEVAEGEGWCSLRCEKDEDCPGECLCSCEAEGCSVEVAFGSFGNSDRQCVSVEFLRKIDWRMMKKDGRMMKKDGGSVH